MEEQIGDYWFIMLSNSYYYLFDDEDDLFDFSPHDYDPHFFYYHSWFQLSDNRIWLLF